MGQPAPALTDIISPRDSEVMYYSPSRGSRANADLTKALYEELGSAVQGTTHLRTDPNFLHYSKTFNGNVETVAKVIVCPLDATDVSIVVKFCAKHALSLSVKAGGYSTAGWAINGDVIIEMSKLKGCNIEPPGEDGSYTSLRDIRLAREGKGKAAALPNQDEGTSGKRRRDDDAELRTYSDASRAMDQFLHGGRPDYGDDNLPSHSIRQRLGPRVELAASPTEENGPHSTSGDEDDSRSKSDGLSPGSAGSRSKSTESSGTNSSMSKNSDSSSRSHTNSRSSTTSTAQTSPSPPAEGDGHGDVFPKSHSPLSMDPFAYMNAGSSSAPAPVANVSHFPPAPPAGATQASMSSSSLGGFNASMFANWRPPTGPLVGSSGAEPPSLMSMAESMAGPSTSYPRFYNEGPFGRNGFHSRGIVDGNYSMFDPTSPTAPIGLLAQAEPRYPHAYVAFGAAMRTKELDQFTHANPLEATSIGGAAVKIPYHVPLTAHPVGSGAVLLAGFGFLTRLRGLSIDNLVEVEMVLADGRIIIVNKDEHPDLFFCIRGAGPAFGCVTRMLMKAYPVPLCFAGNLVYNFHGSTAGSLIKHVRDCVKSAPNELYVNILLTAGPVGQGSLVVVQMCYLGSREKGQEYLDAISAWDGERCILNEITEKNFLAQQDSVAQVLRGQAGRQWFIRSALIHSLPDEIVAKTVFEFSCIPYGCTWFFELAKGILPTLEGTCVPKEQREASFTIAALHQWEMGNEDARCVDTAEHWIYKTLKPVSIGGPLPSFLGRHEPVERTMASYGKNWDRLYEMKRKYDPTGLFSNNFWPLDNDGKHIDPIAHEPIAPHSTVS